MSEHSTVYEKAITTHRTANTIARVHGFESVAVLAESLPEGAEVIDVGAGASPFGNEVAALRPDIKWINFDYSYRDPAILEEVTKGAPPNVEYVFGDATKLEEKYKAESFDAIFSYWIMPHLSIDSPVPAEATARAIFRLGKPDSFISIGPRIGKGRAITLRARQAYHVIKNNELHEDTFVETLVNETQLRGSALRLQKLANEVATPFLGTTRYIKSEGRIPKIYHPDSGEYVTPFSRKGVTTVGGLATAATKYAITNRKIRSNT